MRARWIWLGTLPLACASAPATPATAPAAPPLTANVAPPPPSAAAPTSAPAVVAPEAADPLASAIAELQRAGLASSGAADVVGSLTTEVGPRLAGSAGDRAAVAWALRTLPAKGLADVHAEKVMVPRWERGVETASLVAPYPHKLAVTALGWSGATKPGGIEADVVEVDSIEALSALDAKAVAGKIVFINKVMRRAKDGAGYGETVGIRAKGPADAQKKGALAVLIRSVGTDHDRLPHTGSMRWDKKGGPSAVAAALSTPDADLLHRVIEEKKTARIKLDVETRVFPDAESANVVGEVRGREHPEQVVLLGAHLDSWDLGTGAIDDGAGVGIVVEAARLLTTLHTPPRRTVRVVLFAAEENSLAGGRTYAKAHAAEAPSIVAALEADSGGDRVYEVRYLGDPAAHARYEAIPARLAPLGIAASNGEAHGGADISPLRALGVPAVDLEQDRNRYFDLHHTANDTFDKIDKDAIAQVATAFATAAYSIAEMDGDFGRVPEKSREEHW